jgi:hypothetical protein
MQNELKEELAKHFHKCQSLKEAELVKQLNWLEGVQKAFKTERERLAYVEGFNHGFGVLQSKWEKEVYYQFVK